MGYPSSGREGIYRNPMPDVQRFFETYHKEHYKVGEGGCRGRGSSMSSMCCQMYVHVACACACATLLLPDMWCAIARHSPMFHVVCRCSTCAVNVSTRKTSKQCMGIQCDAHYVFQACTGMSCSRHMPSHAHNMSPSLVSPPALATHSMITTHVHSLCCSHSVKTRRRGMRPIRIMSLRCIVR